MEVLPFAPQRRDRIVKTESRKAGTQVRHGGSNMARSRGDGGGGFHLTGFSCDRRLVDNVAGATSSIWCQA